MTAQAAGPKARAIQDAENLITTLEGKKISPSSRRTREDRAKNKGRLVQPEKKKKENMKEKLQEKKR